MIHMSEQKAPASEFSKAVGKRSNSLSAMLSNIFGEIFGELILYALFFAIGLGVISLIDIDAVNLDGDTVVLIGMAVLAALIAIIAVPIVFLKRKRKDSNKKQKNNEVREYSFKNIQVLYDRLAEKISCAELEDFHILLKYGNDQLTISKGNENFFVKINGEKKLLKFENAALYHLALDFAHEMRIDTDIIEIRDKDIISFDGKGMTYVDSLKRTHFIDLYECAANYESEYTTKTNCVGQYDSLRHSYILFTSDIKIKIVSAPTLSRGEGKIFTGSKKKRFGDVQNKLKEHGYYVCDMLTVSV